MAGTLKPCKPPQVRNSKTNRCKKKSLKPCKPHQVRNPKTNRCVNKKTIKCSSRRTRRYNTRSTYYPVVTIQEPVDVHVQEPETVQEPVHEQKPKGLSSLILQDIESLRSEHFIPDVTEDSFNKLNKDMIDILYGVYRAANEGNMDLQGRLNFLDKKSLGCDPKNPYDPETRTEMNCGLSLVGPVDFSYKNVDTTTNVFRKVVMWRTHVKSENAFRREDLKWAIGQSLTRNDPIDMCFLGDRGFIRLRLGKIFGAPGDSQDLNVYNMEIEVDKIFDNSINIVNSVNQYLKEYGYIEHVDYTEEEAKARKIPPIHWEYAVFLTGAISAYNFHIFEKTNVKNYVDKQLLIGYDAKLLIAPPPEKPSSPTILLDHPDTGYIGPQLLLGYNISEIQAGELSDVLVEHAKNYLIGRNEIWDKNYAKFQEAYKKYLDDQEVRLTNYDKWLKQVHQIFLNKEFVKIHEYLDENPLMLRGPITITAYEKWQLGLKYILEASAVLPDVVDSVIEGVVTASADPISYNSDVLGAGAKKAGEVTVKVAKEVANIASQVGIYGAKVSGNAAFNLFTQFIRGLSLLVPDDLPVPPQTPVPPFPDFTQPPPVSHVNSGDLRKVLSTKIEDISEGVSARRHERIEERKRLLKFFDDSVISMIDGLPEKENILDLLKSYNTKEALGLRNKTGQDRFLEQRKKWRKTAFEEMNILVGELLSYNGTDEEVKLLHEKGPMKFLQDLSDEEAKNIAQRVSDYEKTVEKEISDYNVKVKKIQDSGGKVPLMEPTYSQISKMNSPHLGLKDIHVQNFVDMVTNGQNPTGFLPY